MGADVLRPGLGGQLAPGHPLGQGQKDQRRQRRKDPPGQTNAQGRRLLVFHRDPLPAFRSVLVEAFAESPPIIAQFDTKSTCFFVKTYNRDPYLPSSRSSRPGFFVSAAPSSGSSVLTSSASAPNFCTSSQSMTSVSPRPSRPNSLGRPSISSFSTLAVCGSMTRSSILPRHAPSFSWTTSFLLSSRNVIVRSPFFAAAKTSGNHRSRCAILCSTEKNVYRREKRLCIKTSFSISAG